MREWLVERRKQLNYTQAEVAAAAKIAQPTYCNIETGKKSLKPPTAKRIAEVLKFPWTQFFDSES